jgi:hypothetical protein
LDFAAAARWLKSPPDCTIKIEVVKSFPGGGVAALRPNGNICGRGAFDSPGVTVEEVSKINPQSYIEGGAQTHLRP